MMRAMLIALAMLAVLGVAGICEEPAAPVPAATPVPGTETFGMHGRWATPSLFEIYVRNYWLEGIIFLAIAWFFVAGLRQHRHDWKPLVLGLFAMGFILLLAVWNLSLDLAFLAAKGGGNALELTRDLAIAAREAAWAVSLALIGGFLTVILRWRNERFRAEQAEAEAEEAAEG